MKIIFDVFTILYYCYCQIIILIISYCKNLLKPITRDSGEGEGFCSKLVLSGITIEYRLVLFYQILLHKYTYMQIYCLLVHFDFVHLCILCTFKTVFNNNKSNLCMKLYNILFIFYNYFFN